jgi:hypothetical protein
MRAWLADDWLMATYGLGSLGVADGSIESVPGIWPGKVAL